MSLRYQVRSRQLVDVANELKAKRLILAPYFQRKLVWRESHKADFIRTILDGYPFPEVFFSRGRINLNDMTSTSSVVDGQQRLTTIVEFLNDKLEVDGRKFSTLAASEKEAFLKYEIAVIELDLASDDARVIEMFKRLNRTFYALSSIERQATEYASSEFMLVAKFLAGEIGQYNEDLDQFTLDVERVEQDPNISEIFLRWCKSQDIGQYQLWLLRSDTFSAHEISRQVHLQYTLLVMSTLLHGIFQRNEGVKDDLELRASSFEEREQIVRRLNDAASLIELANPGTFWRRKANAFSLIVATDAARTQNIVPANANFKERIDAFANEPGDAYSLAAKEGVNNRRERQLRHETIMRSVFSVG